MRSAGWQTALPFYDDSFDFVRIAHVGLGVPEHMWAQLVEEATRVLAPGCMLEIVDSNLSVVRSRPTATAMGEDGEVEADEDPFAMVDKCFEAVLEKRWVSERRSSLPSMPTVLVPPTRPGVSANDLATVQTR